MTTLESLPSKNPFQPHDGPPQYLDKYREPTFVPSFHKNAVGRFQVVSPDTPYVAVAGRTGLFFLDTRFDSDTAQHIKRQIEESWIHRPTGYTYIDEIEMCVHKKDSQTEEVLFKFDIEYAKVLYAKVFNRLRPELKVPVYNLYRGDWIRDYSEQINDKQNEEEVKKRWDEEAAAEGGQQPGKCRMTQVDTREQEA